MESLKYSMKCPKCGKDMESYKRYNNRDDVYMFECKDKNCEMMFQISLENKNKVRDLIDTKNGKQMAKAMSNFVNSFNPDIKEFINNMGHDHRTLQQTFTGLCLEWLKHLSEQENYDLRNEASVKIAKKIMDAIDGNTYLPMV